MNTPDFPESLTEIEIMHGEAMKEYWQMRVEVLISIDSKRDDLLDAWDCIWKEIDHYFLHECSDSRPEAIAFIREKLIEWAQRNTPYSYRNKLVQNMLEEKRKAGGHYLRASVLIKKIFGR